MTDAFRLVKKHAEARRIGPGRPRGDGVYMEESCLRIQQDTPFSVLLQWRVVTKSGRPGNGTIAHASVSRKELQAIRDYIDLVLPELKLEETL